MLEFYTFMESLPPPLVESILLSETNDTRFERLCLELYQASEGITLLPTSVTYDRGRDAISISHSRGSHAVVLCASLNKKIDEKVGADLARLSSTTRPERLIYCSSQSLSEDKCDHLNAQIRGLLPSTSSALVQ